MKRSCTDCICCLVFIAFLAGLFATSAYGYSNGNPLLLLTTWDADGKSSIRYVYRQWMWLLEHNAELPLPVLACS